MPKKEDAAGIEPVQLGLDSTFRFRCHPGVACFTKCCREIRITLTPYDIIRLKKRLDLSSEAFLAIYTEAQLLEKTDLPMVTLKRITPGDSEENVCPFVRKEGCLVYDDRPTTCRYYPLGVASLSHREKKKDEGFFFFVNEPHCRGFEEAGQQSVRRWREGQGVDQYDAVNAPWTDLIVRKRSFPPNIRLSEKAKQMFFMVSYNIDKFRAFVFESTFLERFTVDDDMSARIREDDVALLKFGLHWLKEILFRRPEAR